MMEWTDRYCRVFHRQLSRHARLYTEMVTAAAVVRGDRTRLLDFDAVEQPVALQIGGADPGELAEAAAIGAEFGYAEINLNVGCPSDRVQSGRFGACLMAEPETVAAGIRAMREGARAAGQPDLPVTVKCRIGIDDQDSERDFQRFVDVVAADGGCRTFVVHARKAWLQGLSPKENRDIPPLDYARVYRLKDARPDLTVAINGGIRTLCEAKEHLAKVDGVMIGRAAYEDPFLLADVDRALFDPCAPSRGRAEALGAFRPFVVRWLGEGRRLNMITRHILGLYRGVPGAKLFRRHLSEFAHRPDAGIEVFDEAVALVEAEENRQARWRSERSDVVAPSLT